MQGAAQKRPPQLVIRHHGERAYFYREDRCQLRQPLEHPVLAVRVIAARVLIEAPKPCAANTTSYDVIVGGVFQRDECLSA